MSYKLNYTDRFTETIHEMDRPEGKMEGGRWKGEDGRGRMEDEKVEVGRVWAVAV